MLTSEEYRKVYGGHVEQNSQCLMVLSFPWGEGCLALSDVPVHTGKYLSLQLYRYLSVVHRPVFVAICFGFFNSPPAVA